LRLHQTDVFFPVCKAGKIKKLNPMVSFVKFAVLSQTACIRLKILLSGGFRLIANIIPHRLHMQRNDTEFARKPCCPRNIEYQWLEVLSNPKKQF